MPDGISPDLMAMMQGGATPTGAPSPTPPVSAPMATPQENAGEKQGAMVQAQMAIDLLEQSLMAFGSETDEGGAVLTALKSLTKVFGEKKDKARGLIPSEIMNLVAGMPKGAGAPPVGAAPQMPGAAPAPQPMM